MARPEPDEWARERDLFSLEPSPPFSRGVENLDEATVETTDFLSNHDSDSEVALIDCWRCGKSVSGELANCPSCRAALTATNSSPMTSAGRRQATGQSRVCDSVVDAPPLIPVLRWFSVLLVASLLSFLAVRGAVGPQDAAVADEGFLLIATAIFTVIQAGLILIAQSRISVPHVEKPGSVCRALTWSLALPSLAVLLTANFGYHAILRDWLGVAAEGLQFNDPGSRAAWFVLVTCFPAVFEELYFRRLALDSLRQVAGLHAAVWVSAVMFGMAHLGQPFSIPSSALRRSLVKVAMPHFRGG